MLASTIWGDFQMESSAGAARCWALRVARNLDFQIVFNHFQMAPLSMLILPFIRYGVTKPVTAVTKGVTWRVP